MKMFLISDNTDTYTGMRLSGIEGVVVHEADEVEQQFEQLSDNKDIGIILITEKLALMCKPLVDRHKLNRVLPLVLEVPDRHSLSRLKESISTYIEDAIGIKL